MRLFGLSALFHMGCSCRKEVLTINGCKYIVKSHLADGGFSSVFLVQNKVTYQLYAVKIIDCHDQSDEKVAMQEAEYYRCFDPHPNLVTCEDVDLVARPPTLADTSMGRFPVSQVRIIFPFFRKGTLQDELNMRKKNAQHIPEERVLRLFQEMCEGVRAMHSHKPHPLAHRDLKPANVLMSEDDRPVWMDFGSMGKARIEVKTTSEARALQDLAAEKCTLPYRAPELFNVESHTSIDERVDIWSLGCCLYALCYFQSPFDQAYQRGDSVALAVLSGNVELPESSIYSPGLHSLIKSMLEVSALQRPFIDGVLLLVSTLLNQTQENSLA